ncbi:hypothetical protein F4553_002650 [Allocatelliglobosispora scoriae]|uniref:Aminoglycoside phosphotransferase domain-containing protein n=1 Tax=Allocatelliglobosispora scoriae TaxID=643052 RepID=A0A841BR33_9ACTN|nr:aminoglycoside phosphotransferase family protein [Allocatelliglobosispora scoriae]MBB5869271.1 hypothetical protein [Allocatelliglobosispora scoriae]
MRTVTLILVDDDGKLLGALPPFPAEVPFWPEVGGVVTTVRERFGIDVAVLRILFTSLPVPHGGEVTYLAQTGGVPSVDLAPVEVDLDDHPHRAAYARVGGPAASLAWAADALDAAGVGPITGVLQQRTWNLSVIWRIATAGGPVWLKQVPSFFAHEGAVIGWLATVGGGPSLIAAAEGRMLLHDIPGDDLYAADAGVRDAVAADLHRYQLAAVGDVERLAALGVPDRRGALLGAQLAGVVAAHGGGDPRLEALAAGLPARLAELAACGLPETLVHGDLHPGNVRGDLHPDGARTIIDWGDSFLGHPGFDILRITERGVTDDERAAITAAWADRWRADVPGCDPERALELLVPLAALRNAAIYAAFVAAIEPAEHPYHSSDVDFWLDHASKLPA